MRSKSVLQFCVAFFLLVISLTLQSLANASLFLTPKHDHHHNHHSCHVNQHKKECIFKSIALPIDQFNDASINQVFTLTQHVPSINQTGFSWINWQGEKGLLPVLSELAQNNPSQSYHNPFDQKDKTPNVNDWMYSASLSDIENIDVALKFKLFHQKKEVWVPLWKAQSTLQEQEEWGWNKIVGWVSNVTCKIGLGHCEDRLVYQIGGYAVIDIVDVGFTYQNNKKIPWIKVVFKGFKHCFNTPPDATDIDAVTNEDQAVAVQLKGSDADNNPLSYTVSTQPKHGKLEGSVPNLTYIPDPNFIGQDEFFYTVNDGSENSTAKVTITVKPVNDAPIAQNQQLTVAEDHPLNLVLTGTDIDSPNLSYAIESQPLHGKVVQVGGQYQYIPDPDYVGEDSFKFSVSDGELSASGLIQVTVTPVNDAPVAQAFDIETAEDTTVEIQLKGTDPDNDILTYTITNRPQHGILVGFGQNLQYIPHPNYFGKDEFTYTVNDRQLISTAIVKINVLPVNDAPQANDQNLTLEEDSSVGIELFGSDLDNTELIFNIIQQPEFGHLEGSGKDIHYVPNPNYQGEDHFVYEVTDGELSAQGKIKLTITPVNDAPLAEDQILTTPEDIALTLKLLAQDVDGDQLTYTILQQPQNGTLEGSQDHFNYIPKPNFYGQDELIYQVSDGVLVTTARIVINVTPINDIPIAEDKEISVKAGSHAEITLTGNDVENAALTYNIATQPQHGTLTIVGDKVIYTPNKGYVGDDTFSYVANDGELDSLPATVKLQVIKIDNRGKDFWLTFLANYSKPEGLKIYIAANEDAIAYVEVAGLNYKKEVVLKAGTVTTVDLIELYEKMPFMNYGKRGSTLSDTGIHIYSEQLISAYALNQLQYTTDAAAILPTPSLGKKYIAATYTFLSNLPELIGFVATEDNTKIIVSPATGQANGIVPIYGQNYTVTLNKGQAYHITPSSQNLTGTMVESDKPIAFFSGNVCTNIQGTACDHLYEQIIPIEKWSKEYLTSPLATRKNGDTFRVYAAYDNTQVFIDRRLVATLNQGAIYETILKTASLIQSNQPILVHQFSNGSSYDGVPSDPFMVAVPAVERHLSSYIFTTPATGFNKNFINVIATDEAISSLLLNGAKPQITWNNIPKTAYKYAQIPIALGSYSIKADAAFGLTVYGFNSYDSYGYTGGLDLSQFAPEQIDLPLLSLLDEDTTANLTLPTNVTILTQPTNGTLKLENGQYIYTPKQNYFGRDYFTYKTNKNGQVIEDIYNLNIVPVDDAPEIKNLVVNLAEDSIQVSFSFPNKDVDGDVLKYTLIDSPKSALSIRYLSGNNDIQQYGYQPKKDFNGQDQAIYEVTDGKTKSTVTVTLNVTPINDNPVAQALNLSVNEEQSLAIKLQGTDIDGDTLSYSITRPPTSGVVTGQGQDYVYTPNANFSGTDTFEYMVSDGKLIHKAVVMIVVNPINDAPVANNQDIEVRKNKTGSIVLTATDVDSTNLTYQVSSSPSHGTITGTAPNFVYTPATGYVGADEFQFTVSDGTLVGTGRVQIQVVDTPNRLPEWQSVPPAQAEVGTLYQYTLQATDPDQDPITYRLAVNAPQGMSISGNVLSWTPQEEQEGNVEFQVTATDTENGSTAQTVKVTVQARNVAPVIHSKPSYSTTATKPYKYQLIADDANQDKLTYSLDQAPVGMKINAETGLLTWEQAVEGQYNLVVKVSDGRWIVSQSYTLNVTPLQPLSVEIVVSDQIKLNGAFSIKAQVGGSSSNTTVQLLVDSVEIALDNNYQATLTLSQSGQHTVTVIAKDGTETQTKTINIWVADTSDTTVPQVTLNGLDNLATITKPTPIMGQISDQNPSNWTVSLYDVDGEGRSVWTKEGQGNINGELAVIDPTLLVNGVYTVLVRVVDIGGNVTEVVRDIIIDGKMKVGELAFTLEDAVIPMPGLDISLQRSYDSRLGHRVGDFGHAWSLGIQQMQMRQSRPIHTGWETYMKSILLQTSGTQLGTICLRQRNSRPLPTVTVTLPNGDVETFQVELGCASGLRDRNTGEIIQGNSFPVTFKPVGDTQSRFNIIGETTVSVINGRWSSSSVQEIDDNGNVDYLWYIPSEFSITTQDQVSYYFSKTQGITKIVEPTGNTLTINRNGIFHSTGTAIQFVRDSSGRITTTTLPDNTMWKYEYDAAGDLVKAIAPNGVENLYVYNGQHRLLKITDKDANLLTGYEYDADGRLIAILDAKGQRVELTHQLEQNTEQVKDRLGRVTTYTYDDYGNITKEVDALGHITTRTFNDRYDQLSETDALGHTITWTYDDKHNKLTETNHLGQMTSYSYDSNGKMLTETDHTGRIVSDNRYDSSGQLTELKNAAGQTTSMSYGSSGLTGLTDVAGHTTSYVYTGDNLTETTDPTGRKTRYSYDANKRKLSETVIYIDGSGAERQLQTRFEYDSKGRLVKQIDADGGISTKTYGIADELLSETNRFGQTTTYQYDANKKLIQTTYADGTSSKTVYDAEEQVLQETDRLGRVTQYQYDLAGRKTKTTLANGAVLTTQYDAVGNILSETNALGQSTRYEYDGLNRKIKTTDSLGNVYITSYDELGRVSKETDALGQITQHQYNALNQRTKTTYANGNSIQTEYNTLGQKIAVTDELSRRTQYQYDLGGRLIQVTDPMGQSTQYSYDNAGHKLSQTDALGRVTRWEYDALGREIKRILPLGQSSSQSYDSNGLLSQSTDFNGQVTQYSYDSNQRLKQKSFADGETESYSYDVEGQLLQSQQNKADGITTTSYQYDAMGNLLQENRSTGDILSYGYDLVGNKLFVKAKNGQHEKITTYQYDVLNRLISSTDHLGTTSYNYNAVGNRLNEVKANGIITGYAYDERNRLTAIAHAKAGQVIASYAYQLDAAGQRLSMIEHTGRTTTWSYDTAGRLLEENIQNGQNPQSTQYQYDAVGNRIEQTINNVKTTYQYDANDRLSSENKAGSLTEYSYDPQGNLLNETKQGQTTTYQYNAENELTQTQQAGQQIQYSYDLNGIRTEQDNNGLKTHYLNDHNMPYASVLMELQNQQPTATYTYGDDLISYHQGTGSQYYLYDALGSTRALTNENGQITDSYNYDAFGANTEHQGSSNNKYQYAGEQKDSTGNYYLRARYYNPSIGRFTQMDSYMGQSNNPITLHKYLYANANPVMYTDPSGYMFSLSGVMSGISMQAGLATMRYGAVSIGRTVLGGVIRPHVQTRINSHVGGMMIAGLIYVAATNYCQNADNCEIPMPLIFYGNPHGEVTGHIFDAQLDGISSVLHRSIIGGSRALEGNWYSNMPECKGNVTGLTGKSCDEYPFNSAIEGGSWNYTHGDVSLRLVKHTDNMDAGRFLNSMYSADRTNTGEPYMVLALRGLPKSFFITRKGTMVIK